MRARELPAHEAGGRARRRVHFWLRYRNDRALPVHRQFEPCGVYIAHRDEAACSGNDGGYAAVWRERELAVEMGKGELGSAYAATGAYYLVLKFGDGADGGAVCSGSISGSMTGVGTRCRL